MPCKFPYYKPTYSYRKGCRCDGCRAAKREAAKKSTPKFQDRHPGTKARYPVPVGPILELLEGWLEKMSAESEAPYETLAKELGVKDQSSAMRMMSRYRNGESTRMGFDMADKIVSTLYGPHYWYENEVLYAIYEECA